jgi:hypothetical protein
LKEGVAGTVAHRVGGAAFGTLKRKRSHLGIDTVPEAQDDVVDVLRKEEASQQLALVIRNRRVEQESESKQLDGAETAVAEWSKLATKSIASQVPCMADGKDDLDFHALPCGVAADGQRMHLAYWPAPGPEIARRALSRSDLQGLRRSLRNAWEERHIPFQHHQLPRCKDRKKPRSTCFVAGFCGCQEPGKPAFILGKALQKVFLNLLRKQRKQDLSAQRILYDNCALFIYIHTSPRADLYEHKWFHVGWGNLNSGELFLMPLAETSRRGRIVTLHRAASTCPVAGIDALRRLPRDIDWDLEVFQLSGVVEAVPGAFAPDTIRVEPMAPAVVRPLWRVPLVRPPRALPAPQPRPALDDRDIGDADDLVQDRDAVVDDEVVDDEVVDDEGDIEHMADHGDDGDVVAGDEGDDDISDDDGDLGIAPPRGIRRAGLRLFQANMARQWYLGEESNDDDDDDRSGHTTPVASPYTGPAPPNSPPAQPHADEAQAPPLVAVEARETGGSSSSAGPVVAPRAADVDEEPVPVPAPVARGPRAGQAARGSRATAWGPFFISEVVRSDVQVGWGTVCKRHTNCTDTGTTECKRQVTYGKKGTYSDIVCVKILKLWLLGGFNIAPDDRHGRERHLKEYELRFLGPDVTDEDLDQRLAAAIAALPREL